MVSTNSQIAEDILKSITQVIGSREEGEFVPLHEPDLSGNELAYVTETVTSGWVSSVGKFVDRFEESLADFTGASHAIATVNGTAALHVCLQLAGVRPGDEVLMPALTFIATANAASYAGAIPHFVDSEEDTMAVDPEALESHLTRIAKVEGGVCRNLQTGARISALVVMHVFGHPAKLDRLSEIAQRWNLVLVEDAAESLGSYIGDCHTGNTGALSALSFNGNKIATTGGGGAILTNDPDLALRAKHLTTTARVPDRWNFVHDEVGFNYRLPNLNAALGCAQIERLGDMLTRKRLLAASYREIFANSSDVDFVAEPAGSTSNYWLCALKLRRSDHALLEEVLELLNANGVMARPLWTLMHRLAMYSDSPRADLNCAEDLANRIVNIPSSPSLAGPAGNE